MTHEAKRCDACPFHFMAEAFAEAVAARLCPKSQTPSRTEVLIPPDEAARRLGKSRSWLDRRRFKLPYVRLRDTRGYDVIESKLEEAIRGR